MNCYAEQLPEDAKTPFLVQRTPGITTLATIGNGPIYATHYAFGYLWVVSGTKLYRVSGPTASYAATLIGDIGTIAASGVDVEHNDTSIVVVNNPRAYYYTLSTATFAEITDADFPGASYVEFLGNFLLFVEPDSGRFFCADLGSPSSFDALNFATAEGAPDDLVGIKADHQQAVLFGQKSVEIWDLTAVSGFPFQRASNGYVEIGCLSGESIAKQDNSVFWLADDYTIRRLDGATPLKISTTAVDQSILLATISACRAFAFSLGGQLYYVISFPEITWIYNATSGRWHNGGTYGYDYWTAGCHAQAFGFEIVGHTNEAYIGKLDPLVFAEWGGVLRSAWQYQTIYAEGRTAIHDEFELICETGVGLVSGQGSAPEIMLDYSDDGGITWESLPNKSLGPMGEYTHRVKWNRLGSARQRTYRAAISDPVKVAITDTQVKVRGGRW